MSRWLLSRPALFVAGVMAGIWGTNQVAVPQGGADAKPAAIAAKTANPEKQQPEKSQKETETVQRFEPLPEADDKVARLQIPRISGGAESGQPAAAVASSNSNGISRSPAPGPDAAGDQYAPKASVPIAVVSEVQKAGAAFQSNPVVVRELARSIQNELVRVGCRPVAVSGRWDSRSVRASAKFIANRNARLPADRPDVVLLSLLRGYQGGECGLGTDHRNSVTTGATTGTGQPVPIRSAGLPPVIRSHGIGQAIGTGVALPVTPENPAAANGPLAERPKRSAKPRRTASRRTSRRRTRKARRSWRHKVHYGIGLDD